jgi:hypothetical protein
VLGDNRTHPPRSRNDAIDPDRTLVPAPRPFFGATGARASEPPKWNNPCVVTPRRLDDMLSLKIGRTARMGGDHDRAWLTAKARAAGSRARMARANGRAADIFPVIAELHRAGITSLRAIADALNERHIPAPRGGAWQASQVRRVLLRLKT